MEKHKCGTCKHVDELLDDGKFYCEVHCDERWKGNEHNGKWLDASKYQPTVFNPNAERSAVLVIATDGITSFPLKYTKRTKRGKTVYQWEYPFANTYARIYKGYVKAWMPMPTPPKDGEQE